jgi:hypothetical protein
MPNYYGQRTGSDNLADFIGNANRIAQQNNQAKNELNQQKQGKQQDLSNALTEQQNKANLGEQEQQRNLQQLQDLIGGASGKGKKISAKIGDVQYSDAETDPYVRMRQGENDASKQFTKIYNQGLPKIQQAVSAAGEGLKSIDDPAQMGSVGQARTLMLKTMGMSRYNEKEAAATLPPTLLQYAHQLFNTVGDDANPIQPNQKEAVRHFFQSALDTSKQQHDMLYQNAVNAYNISPYAAPNRDFSGQRKPMDTFLDQSVPKPPPAPPSSPTGKPLANTAPPTQPTDPWWKRILPSQQPQASQSVPAPQSAPQQAAPAADGFDPNWIK